MPRLDESNRKHRHKKSRNYLLNLEGFIRCFSLILPLIPIGEVILSKLTDDA